MSVQSQDEFHDPVLKEAVRRCWSCDCASEHLRRRVTAILVEEEPEVDRSRRAWRINRPVIRWSLVAAAVVALSCAILFLPATRRGSQAIATALPVGLENDLIRRHDECCKLENHQHPGLPKNDVAIADYLRETLKRPVLVFHPADAAWKFTGASICPVGTVNSGHLVFLKGDEALSIFSLPKTLVKDAAEGSQFSATVDGHPIVGFVKDNALFCVVGSGPAGTVSLDELQQMSQQMKPAVAEGPAVVPTGVVLTELLRPIR